MVRVSLSLCVCQVLVSTVMPVCLLGLTPVLAQENLAPANWIRPPALEPGDTIAFVAPAGPAEWKPVLKYASTLRKAGFKVRIPKGLADRRFGYLAGTDAERTTELNDLIRDPSVQAIFPVRGGYGLTRILDKIDYSSLRANPKIITGYSDVTALHLAIAANAKLVTFHSPMPMSKLWQTEDPKFAYATCSFERAVFSDQYQPDQKGYSIELPDNCKPQRIVGGKACGRLLGGNLTLVCSTLGTRYAIEPENAILMIEDVNEAPYRVDRALSQLRLAGVLDAVAGVLLGSFTENVEDDTKEFDRVLLDYFASSRVPVIMHYPVGHTRLNTTLPHGGLVEIDADALKIRLLENPVNLN